MIVGRFTGLKVDGQQNKNWTVYMNKIRNCPLSINMQPIKSDKFIMKMKVTKRLVTENKINGPYHMAQIIRRAYYACNISQDGDSICGILYVCNFSFDRDHICLQSGIFLKHFESDRLGSKSYLIKFEIAGIFGPLSNQDCRHIWTIIWSLP